MGQSASTGSEFESRGEGLCDDYGEKAQNVSYSEDNDNDDIYSGSESYESSQDGDEDGDEGEEVTSSDEEDKGITPSPAPQDSSSNKPDEEKEESNSDLNGHTTANAAVGSPSSINLALLSDEELKSHLSKYVEPMTKFDIRNTASEHQDAFISTEEHWYTQTQTPTQSQSQLQSATADIVQPKSHMDVALSILKLSPEIRALRFKLVPAKLSEYRFWSAVFFLLENCTPDSLGSTTLLLKVPTKVSNEHLNNNTEVDSTQIQDPTTKATTGTSINGSTGSTNVSSSIIQRKDKELASLRHQLAKTKEELSLLQEQYAQLKLDSESAKSSGTCSTHRGKWIKSQESLEFAALDEELKEKLREGKKQRLKDVEEQMKFILVSDDVKDSNGKWDCCGETVYSSTCVKI